MARIRRKPKVAGREAARVPASTTGYQSQGVAAPQAANMTEIGSSQPVVIREVVPELASAFQRLQAYNKMMNDAGVDVSMRAAKAPILGSDFFVEPFDDTELDIDVADFVSQNLMEGMSAPFLNSLEDVLHMFEDGYAVLEKAYENRQWTAKRTGANAKTYTMLRKLAVRPANTIKQIVYDNNGGPTKVIQSAIQADGTVTDKTLDIGTILIFTFGRRGGDLTGKSLLRTAYPHWYYKTHFYKIDAIQKERHGIGVPKGKLGPGATTADKNALRSMLRNLRTNEESFAIVPPSVDVEFMDLPGNLVNVLDSAREHNIMILMNVMAQFLALGLEGNGGGRATGGSQTDIYMKSLRYVANYICDVVNMYLIPELVVYNFPTTNFPTLKVRNIGETRDLQMLGSALGNVLSQGGITMDLETENWIRRVFDMPLKIASEYVTPVAGSQGGGGSQNGKSNNGKGATAQKPGDGGNTSKPANAPQ